MAEKKVTTMVITVDLNCEKCHKKIKKVLCKIPREYLFLDFFNFLDIYIYILNIRKVTELFCNFGGALSTREIQNQVYDEKANTVTITVVCCSPEKIKKTICCKGGDSVIGIEIKVPEKPKPIEPEKPRPIEPEKPKEKSKPDKPVVVIVDLTKLKDPEPTSKKPEPAPAAPPVRVCCRDCYEGRSGGPCYHGFGRPPPCYEGYGRPASPPPKAPEPAPAPPPKKPEPEPAPAPPPVRVCCRECYEGRGGGPCYHGFGRPPPCYEGYGRPAPPPPKAPEPAPAPPPRAPEPGPAPPPKAPEPVRVCCMECYEGQGGGPCYHGFGRPPPCYEGHGRPAPPPCYEAYGRPVYESLGGGVYYGGCRRGCNVGRCDCLSEENPAGCIVM